MNHWWSSTRSFGAFIFRSITRNVMALVFDIIAAPLQAGMLGVFAAAYTPAQRTFLTPGLVFYSILATSVVSTTGHVVTLRDARLLRRFRASPVATSAVIAGIAGGVALVAFCSGLLTYAVAHIVSGVPWPARPAQTIGVWLVASLTMTSVGLLLARVIARPPNAVAVALPLLFTSIFLSGLYAKSLEWPTGFRAVSWLYPARPVCDWLRAVALGVPLPAWWESWLAVAWLTVLGFAAVRSFKWE